MNRYRYDELSHSPYPVFASMYSLHLDVRWGSWIEYFTDDGVPYYYNSDTQETAWEIPAEALQAPVAKKGPPALPPRTYLNSSGTHGATGKTPTAAVIPAVGLPSVEDDDGLTSNPLFGDSTNTHLFAASNAGLHDSQLSPHEREHKYSVEHAGDTGMTSVRVPSDVSCQSTHVPCCWITSQVPIWRQRPDQLISSAHLRSSVLGLSRLNMQPEPPTATLSTRMIRIRAWSNHWKPLWKRIRTITAHPITPAHTTQAHTRIRTPQRLCLPMVTVMQLAVRAVGGAT